MQTEIEIKNVLWIRVGALGDLLIATAALEETLCRFPNANLSILGPRVWVDLIDPNLFQRVDRILVPEEKGSLTEWRLSKTRVWESKGVVFQKEIWREFDAVVNHRIESLRYAIPAWRAGVPVRIGSGPRWTRFMFSHWSPDLGKDPVIHERDWHLRVATAPAISNGPSFWQASVANNRLVLNSSQFFGLDGLLWNKWNARGLPRLCSRSPEFCLKEWGLSEKSYFLVNPTSSRREKAWKSSNYCELVGRLTQDRRTRGLTPVIVGAPSETAWLNEGAGEDYRRIQPPTVRHLFHLVEGARF
ncbi:MAG: hypothetical protein K2X47_10860, partial [Bdellovibrionales bacterium]|nr:hypothetical protein [Bdellovibrionales bacterium]